MFSLSKNLHWLLAAALVVVVAGICVQIGAELRQRQQAVAAVEALGGRTRPLKRGPGWLRDTLGNGLMKVFDGVYLVNLQGREVTDEDLRQLRDLPEMQRLNLRDTPIDDSGLVHVGHLTELRALDLGGTQVTDAGLIHLKGLKRLRYLYLDGTGVTDAGLRHLHGLRSLQHLDVEATEVTAEGLERLRRVLPRLKEK